MISDRFRLRRRHRQQRAAAFPRLSRRPRRRRPRADRSGLLRPLSRLRRRGRVRAMATTRGVRWNVDADRGLVGAKAVRLEALERDGSVLFPGAADAIRRAAAAVPIAIASGALRRGDPARARSRATWPRCFAAIVAAEDTPASKPAPDPVLCARWHCSRSAACRSMPPRSAWRSRTRAGAWSRRARPGCGRSPCPHIRGGRAGRGLRRSPRSKPCDLDHPRPASVPGNKFTANTNIQVLDSVLFPIEIGPFFLYTFAWRS